MFERYTEKARRTIFFARYEASQFGSPYIETEHLLLGLLREDKALANRFLRWQSAIESIRKQIETHTAIREKVSTAVDLPLSNECQHVLAFGSEEVARLNHKHIDTEHLLLGLLREKTSFAAQLLHEQGLTVDSVRQQVQKSELPLAEGRSASFARLDRWLAERESHGGIFTVKQRRVGKRITQFAIYTVDQQNQDETDQDMPPPQAPLLCIEVIRDERFSDSNSKRAYTITKADGLREFRGGILQITNPPLEMDLRTIFD